MMMLFEAMIRYYVYDFSYASRYATPPLTSRYVIEPLMLILLRHDY